MKTKTALSAVFLVLLTALLFFGAERQHHSLGQHYYVYSLSGKEIGASQECFDYEKEVLSARQQVMREHPGEYLLFSAEADVSEGRELFRNLDSAADLREKILQVMRSLADEADTACFTVRTGDFSASFQTKKEAEEFLLKSKASLDPDNLFVPVYEESKDHETGTSKAVLIKKESLSSEITEKGNEEKKEESAEKVINGRAGVIPAFLNPGDRPMTADYVASGVTEAFWQSFSEILSDPAADRYETGLVDMSYLEPVYIYLSLAGDEGLDDISSAVTEATKEEEKNRIYTVKSGDTLSQIAENYGLSLEKLLQINAFSSMNETIHIDQELIVAVPEPELKIRTVEGVILEEDYMANPVYIPNNDWYTTEEKIVSEGKIGHREVNAFLIYENGTEQERVNVHTKVLKESIPTEIERGTIVPPTYIKPISGGRFTSGFGRRWGRMHKGVDWACPTGTIVFASSDGVVEYAGWGNGYGNTILISHPDGRKTRVGHLSKILVSDGQSVKQGQTIGLSGSTGRSTGPHVHFEIYINGAQVNPLDYIS